MDEKCRTRYEGSDGQTHICLDEAGHTGSHTPTPHIPSYVADVARRSFPRTVEEFHETHPADPAKTLIGWVTVPEDFIARKGYEVAAWYTLIRVAAGRYPVYGTTINGQPWSPEREGQPYWAIVRLEGTVVEQYMPSLFGGVAYGTTPNPRDKAAVGTEATKLLQMYGYDFAKAAAEGAWEWNGDPQPLQYEEADGLGLVAEEREYTGTDRSYWAWTLISEEVAS